MLAQRRSFYTIFCMAHCYREYPHILLCASATDVTLTVNSAQAASRHTGGSA